MKQLEELIIENYIPRAELSEIFKEYNATYGSQALEVAYRLRIIEANIKDANRAHLQFQLVKKFLDAISFKDPLHFHYDIARQALSSVAAEALQNDHAIDLLARELVKALNKLSKKLKTPQWLNQCCEECDRLCQEKPDSKISSFHICLFPKADDLFEEQFFSNGFTVWDEAYLHLLKSIGPRGRKEAVELSKKIKNLRPLSFWFCTPNQNEGVYYFHSVAFIGLAAILWEDICKKSIEKHKNTVPALTKKIITTTIRPLMSKDLKIITNNNKIVECFENNGNLLCSVACVDLNFMDLICKGIKYFPSITGQRLLRWQVNMGYQNWKTNCENPALICTQGGYRGIAQAIGSSPQKNPEVIGQVRAILQAEAFCKFTFPDGSSGNLIVIREIEKHKNGEPSKINIILGDVLLPNYGQFLAKGKARRLIPIPAELPPLIGSRNTHSAQGMLQLLILNEFSDQSQQLVEHGSVCIPIAKWEEFARQVHLPIKCLPDVIRGWTEGDAHSTSFLVRQGDEYILASSFASVNDFFTYQGKQRVLGSIAGKKSSEQKKCQIQRGYKSNCRKKDKVR